MTGGAGFLGSHVVEELARRGCKELFVPRASDFDLRRPDAIARLLDAARPEVVLHLAAVVGGIGANRENPGRFFYDNLMMGVELMEQSRLRAVEKFVALGTVCAYPKFTPAPFRENDFWRGYPEETNAPYGLAKKMLLVQAQAYRQQYGFNAIYLLPSNLYGPRDTSDPSRSHVIPALIRRCLDAIDTGVRHIDVWGTGTATRDFLYVEDCARAIVMACERYDGAEPINLGSGREITIANLARLIAELSGFGGEIRFERSKPDGQLRRVLDVSRAERELGFRATTDLAAGLKNTIEWFRAARRQGLAA